MSSTFLLTTPNHAPAFERPRHGSRYRPLPVPARFLIVNHDPIARLPKPARMLGVGKQDVKPAPAAAQFYDRHPGLRRGIEALGGNEGQSAFLGLPAKERVNLQQFRDRHQFVRGRNVRRTGVDEATGQRLSDSPQAACRPD
jgi:hypothetical protein